MLGMLKEPIYRGNVNVSSARIAATVVLVASGCQGEPKPAVGASVASFQARVAPVGGIESGDLVTSIPIDMSQLPWIWKDSTSYDPQLDVLARKCISIIKGDIEAPEQARVAAVQALADHAMEDCDWGLATTMPDEKTHRARIQLMAAGLASERVKVLVPVVAMGLNDESAIVRREAAVWLSAMGPVAFAAGECLRKALTDTDAEVRCWAARALFTATGEALMPVEVSIGLLEHVEKGTRINAIHNLGIMGAGAYRALPFLEKLLQSDDEDIRLHVLDVIERLRPLAPSRHSDR